MLKIPLKRLLPLLILLLLLFLFFYFRLGQYLSFDSLKEHRTQLITWTKTHYLATVLAFMGTYILTVAIAVPGALFLTLTSGFLFGIFWGTLYVIISATIGATLLFLAVHSALGEWLSQKTTQWITKMKKGFHENAFSYLIILRLIPVFPFWAINIVSGLLKVKPKTFILATFIGIIPGAFIYAMIGNSLGLIFDRNEKPDLHIVFSPEILLPLIALALLLFLPIIYHQLKEKHRRKKRNTSL
ncbi:MULTISPECIES: TVP38/TMEM64 family protein [Legionella]|uniref:TVP38/TMEM64 family membrane protein n=1 Tax=Legionella feeleii TaxID=453 RepID=A0A0W0TIG7_9GAMM|nr:MULTISPECIES: TVP38/TMEM64 family protein [Legionella]KTC95261.1 mercuric reductase [Legionella feeleii]MCC5015024.1 TVP38/TMEM64 family protein [Legionella sp. 31fI33]SPX59694.1 mercuric reductase [Legionella feeleii]